MSDFGDSALGHGIAIALVLIALLAGFSLLAKSCGDAAVACAEAGGSYSNDGSCTVGGDKTGGAR